MADRRSLLVLGHGGGGCSDVAGVVVGWGRYDLYFLVVLVCVVGWMRGGSVDVWWRGLLISVRDNSRVVGSVCDNSGVVGWLRPCHPVFGGLRFWTVFGLVGAVFAMKKTVEVCATTLGLSAGCARAILSLVAFVSGQSLVWWAQSSP